MNTRIHVLSNVDKNTRTAICKNCGPTTIRPKGGLANYWRCNSPRNSTTRKRYDLKRCGYNYSIHKKATCERCGFVPEDLCQLDVDHIDGNRYNNSPENFQTICANCHRLKSKQESKIRQKEAN